MPQALNPAGEEQVERFGWTVAPGDKVMQIENDYDKDVYNGDIDGRAPLRGGASHEAEGLRGARGGGADRVGPHATRRRLRVLLQIGDKLVPGLERHSHRAIRTWGWGRPR